MIDKDTQKLLDRIEKELEKYKIMKAGIEKKIKNYEDIKSFALNLLNHENVAAN